MVANGHLCITSSTFIKGSHLNNIHDFYEKLSQKMKNGTPEMEGGNSKSKSN